MPDLVSFTEKTVSGPDERHHELTEAAHLFSLLNREFIQHLKQEEKVLFPVIEGIIISGSAGTGKIIRPEISKFLQEHDFAGRVMNETNEITRNYSGPADGCKFYDVTFTLLSRFEDDLYIHIHLEKNMLFPNILINAC